MVPAVAVAVVDVDVDVFASDNKIINVK